MPRRLLLVTPCLALAVACATSDDQPGAQDASTGRPDVGFVEPGSGDPAPAVVVGHSDAGPSSGGADGGAAKSIVINEVDYDNVGSDNNEFVELYNPTSTAVDMTNMAVVFVAGSTKAEYLRVDLSGSLAPGKYLVIGSATVSAGDAGATKLAFAAASNNVRNGGPNGIGILDKASGKLVDALSYDGPLLGASVNGVTGALDFVEGTTATAIDSNTTQGSLCRIPNGADTDDADADWAFSATPTPGTANVP